LLNKARKHEALSEFSEELTMELESIRKLKKEYQEDLDREVVGIALPSTNVKEIDSLFGLFAERFASNGIDLKLKVTSGVVYMIESIVPQGRLETMIGDHLQNALNAVIANGHDSRRCVMAMIGEVEGCYIFSVHDTGIPFEVDTLVRLGTERVTTYTQTGGSGVGFMKTFETMQKCGASLIIRENRAGGAFAKTVTIRFDEKNRYIIDTYRPSDFPSSDRYTVIGY
jgi:signal transduction histidine kinase